MSLGGLPWGQLISGQCYPNIANNILSRLSAYTDVLSARRGLSETAFAFCESREMRLRSFCIAHDLGKERWVEANKGHAEHSTHFIGRWRKVEYVSRT